MKENLISDKSLIYQWAFNDNMSVVDNQRIKATVFGNPTFNNGIATFNGSTDYYKLKTLINLGKIHSIEVKFKQSSFATEMVLLGGDSNNKLSIGTATLGYKATTEKTVAYTPNLNWNTLCFTRSGDNYAMYNNGVSLVNGTGMGTSNFLFNILGALADFTLKYAGQLEYIKIWNRLLTSSEVKNNYIGKTYKALPYVSSEVLGSELITAQADREFSSDTGFWAKTNASITIADGVCHFVNTPDGQYLRRTNVLKIGVLYRVRFKIINCVSGTLRDSFGGLIKSGNGTYDYYINATTTTIGLSNALPNTTLDVEYFYVEEVLQSSKNTLFHINSDNGVIRDLTGKTNPVNTNVQLPKIGSNINVMKFDGSSGNINIGSQALVGDITFMGWVKHTNRGEGNESHTIGNGQFIMRNSASTNKIYIFTRNNFTTTIFTANNTFKELYSTFLCITSTSTGITNFYIGDKNNPPVISGQQNQNAGTPVAGSTCYLGNRAADNNTLNGWLNDIRCEQSILTLEEITQYYSVTKIKY